MNRIKILLVLIFLFISISAVSAEGNFTALQNDIDSSTDSIDINQDYAYDNTIDYELNSGILINKSDFTINGNGHTIDGSNQARIFDISGNNIIISNIIFINGNIDGDFGGALHSSGSITLNNVTFKDNNANCGGAISVSGQCIINNTIFANNVASTSGGAIYAEGKTSINNTIFSNNAALSGGAIFTNGNSNQINCTFENNTAKNGGAVYFNNEITNNIIKSIFNGNNATRAGGAIYVRETAINNTITSEFNNNIAKEASGGGIFFYKTAENNKIESIFTNNIAAYGAGMFFYSESNNNKISSDFKNNTALSCGGAIFFYSKTNNNSFKGNFINNTAKGLIDKNNANGGAITFKNTSKNCIFDCNFTGNTAILNGGAVNYRTTPYNITFKGNFIANSAPNGGGLNFFNEFNNITFNCNFIDNNAIFGGGICINKEESSSNSSGKTDSDHIQTVTNCNFTNNNATKGGAIYTTGSLTLNNLTFVDNYATKEGGAICLYSDVTLNCDNTDFTDNYAEAGSAIYVEKGKLNLYNAELSSKIFNKYSQIAALRHSVINIENVTFANSTSSYSPAMYLRNTKTSIINSKFYNLRGNITAGAIGVRLGGEIYIKNCEFINTTSSKNGGAVYADIAGEGEGGYVTIIDTVFKDTYSDFGGALLQLGGDLLLNDCEFINGHARYNGGSIYLSYVNGAVNNCTFDSNSIELNDMGYPTYGGAIFSDIGTLNITDSKFFNNTASAGSAVYAYDSSYNIKNSTFENNINPIYSFFDKEINIDDSNVFINDSDISTNNTYYATIVTGEGVQLTLLNNTINVSALPSRYDSRDWGWVSPVRAQGWMGACWTFGMTGALESALLKATGIKTDLSENNMQNTMMKYSIYGTSYISEGGYNAISASYLLNWIGAFKQDVDVYDEMGKISPVITTANDIHIQDVVFLTNVIPDCTEIKLAIMKYGSVDASFCGQASYNQENPYYNPETYAQYVDEYKDINHAVSIVGWDDTFSKENFLITPPGDGAWIIKNSWGTDWGNNGYLYVSYYDKSFLQGNTMAEHGTGIIIENTIPYNKNYQYDTVWLGDFSSRNETVSYMNIFEALENDAIAAVGTYFNQSGVNYTIEIYVNEELKLTQEGISPYFGYHTIKLDSYIPIKEGDVFKAIMTSNAMPYLPLVDARMHYTENHSFVSYDGQPWNDSYTLDKIPCLKVYTVALPIYTEDLVKIYKNDSKFEAEIGVANETVTFEINGKNYTRTSDENGTASMAINLGPGNYTIKTMFNDTAVENTITVLPTLIADNLVKYYRNASQFFISLIDGEGNSVSGVNITMNINGVFYNRTTNENGTAKLNINLPPGEYILTAIDPLTGLMISYNITVLPTLIATDLEMTYKDGSTFNVTVLDGQGNPLANAAVKFNINGVFYTKHTDSKGIAKLNINLMSGKYIITSEYDGLKISNTITIND